MTKREIRAKNTATVSVQHESLPINQIEISRQKRLQASKEQKLEGLSLNEFKSQTLLLSTFNETDFIVNTQDEPWYGPWKDQEPVPEQSSIKYCLNKKTRLVTVEIPKILARTTIVEGIICSTIVLSELIRPKEDVIAFTLIRIEEKDINQIYWKNAILKITNKGAIEIYADKRVGSFENRQEICHSYFISVTYFLNN